MHFPKSACFVPATALALVLSPSPALASHGPGEVGYIPGPTELFECENGMTLSVTRAEVQGQPTVNVAFPSGRATEQTAKQLLPLTQTGSGVRYASDIISFHEKNDKAMFSAAESAFSEAIPATSCTNMSITTNVTLTQPARDGSYWVLAAKNDPALMPRPSYRQVETVCFAEGQPRFLSIAPMVSNRRAMAVMEDMALEVTVGEVDAGAGQRRYTVTADDDDGGSEVLTLNFIAPGMREAELPSATSGISSVTSTGRRVGCIDSDDLVYAAVDEDGGATVTLEDGDLVYRSYAGGTARPDREIRGGLFSRDEAKSTFHFFDENGRVRINASNRGAMEYEAWLVESNISRRGYTPKAYFLANPQILIERASLLNTGAASMVDALAICSHLAGEALDDAERNAQLTETWKAQACDTVEASYADTLKNAADGSPMKVWLEANPPSWM